MEISAALFIVALIVAVIWLVIASKRLRHKMFAIFLIALVIFTFLSFSMVVKKNNIDLKTVPGMVDAGKLYFSWLLSVFGNVKTITGNAIGMDWAGGNQTG